MDCCPTHSNRIDDKVWIVVRKSGIGRRPTAAAIDALENPAKACRIDRCAHHGINSQRANLTTVGAGCCPHIGARQGHTRAADCEPYGEGCHRVKAARAAALEAAEQTA